MLLWNEQFETGHSLIDTQHKMLIDYINRLEAVAHTTNPNRKEIEFILQLFGFMEKYVEVHFQQEEDCMFRYRCPAHRENQKAHEDFLNFFKDFKRRYEAEGFRPAILMDLHTCCSAWIQGHILKIDVQLKPCVSQPPGPDQPV